MINKSDTLMCLLLLPSPAHGPFELCGAISSCCSLVPPRLLTVWLGQGMSLSFILLTNQLRHCGIFIGHKYFIGQINMI